jgi:outer membrane lipoprotein LolB
MFAPLSSTTLLTTEKTEQVRSFGLKATYIFLILFSLIQTGCSNLTKPQVQVATFEAPENWESTSKKIEALSSWKLIGKIGIRTPDDSVTAAINQWQQIDSNFIIDLSSTFFGLGASKLYGSPNFLTIQEPGEEPISSYEPDLLIQQALGFPLPISSLSWWIKGIPVPHTPHNLRFNENGHPSTLAQDHWNVSYSKYTTINGLPLPGKVTLKRDDVRIILAIKQWTLL